MSPTRLLPAALIAVVLPLAGCAAGRDDATSHEQACIFTDSAHHTTAEFTGSLYERAVVQDRPVVVGEENFFAGHLE